ncbi:MAG: hypothetical protein D6675_14515 [Gemmatimonadetes bacterium]|nr:MAG: hypothetical protein D6675_14515 [Gemmatimonadota bacterium]
MPDPQTFRTFCTFTLDNTRLGIDVRHVRESFYLPPHFTQIPLAPPLLVGVTVFQQSVLPVLKIHSFLNMPNSSRTATTSVIAVEVNDYQVGIWSDTVPRLRMVDPAGLHVPDEPQPYVSYLFQHEEDLISVLDLPVLLQDAQHQLEID